MNLRKRLREYREKVQYAPEKRFIATESGCYFSSHDAYNKFSNYDDDF